MFEHGVTPIPYRIPTDCHQVSHEIANLIHLGVYHGFGHTQSSRCVILHASQAAAINNDGMRNRLQRQYIPGESWHVGRRCFPTPYTFQYFNVQTNPAFEFESGMYWIAEENSCFTLFYPNLQKGKTGFHGFPLNVSTLETKMLNINTFIDESLQGGAV